MKAYTILVGHYGSGNFGDDIMLAQLINESRANKKIIKVIFFDNWHNDFNLEKSEKILINRKNKLQFLWLYIKNLIKADSLIWGGGTCFTNEEGDGFFIGMILAKLFRVKIIYRSVGIGKITKRTRILKLWILLKISKSISFRDKTSREIAKKLHDKEYNLEPDLGVVYLNKNPINEVTKKKQILVAWRDLRNYSGQKINTDRVAEYISETAKKLKINNVIIIKTDNIVDESISNEIYSKIKNETLQTKNTTTLSYKEKLKLITESQVIITSRLHVLLAGIHYKKDIYVYPYSPKINIAIKDQNEVVNIININALNNKK